MGRPLRHTKGTRAELTGYHIECCLDDGRQAIRRPVPIALTAPGAAQPSRDPDLTAVICRDGRARRGRVKWNSVP